jgi:hypothetical protein
LPREPLLCDSEVPVPRSRIRSALQLRTQLAVVALVLALAGCSSDGIHSPQKFFPGSERTAWNDCGKFTESGNSIAICANTAVLPGATSASYNIQFALPSAEHVRIAVFDENAALVKVLFDADEPPTFPGSFRVPPISWDYTDAHGVHVPPGDYRLYFQAGDFVSTSDLEVP